MMRLLNVTPLIVAATCIASAAVAQTSPLPGQYPPAGPPSYGATPRDAGLPMHGGPSVIGRPSVPTFRVEATPHLITITTPYRSAATARRVLNQLAIDTQLRLGYTEASSGAAMKTAGMTGLTGQRYFSKNGAAGNDTVELALATSAEGTAEVLIHAGNENRPNPDLVALAGFARGIAEGLSERRDPSFENARAGRRLSRHVYNLSYLQADRAMATLKALGYSTIEYRQQSGEKTAESIFEPIIPGGTILPVVVKLVDAAKTSLMDPKPPDTQSNMTMMSQPMQMGMPVRQAIPDIGGTYLHQVTSGEPQQRLMILYDVNDADAMEELVNILRDDIDVPARQVVISALVVEVNTDRLRELGISLRAGNGPNTFEFQKNDSGVQLPLTYVYDRLALKGPLEITATLKALVERGDAEVLSNPSVLVLDGRQARIQVGKQVPVVNSTATAAGITSSVEYFPVGIVLNLRPRVNEDGSEVTMQVETIVSAVSQTGATASQDVFYAPTVDNRQVQTFVRVADSTPFIIGGLIATDNRTNRSGIPLLSQIPYLGALFRTNSQTRTKREVIVVLTPHVVPLQEKDFSYVIPKDSETFDSMDHELFRNAYRVRARDLFDLSFVYESDVLQGLMKRLREEAESQPGLRNREPFASLFAGVVPGEDILVKRMLWEIIRRTGYAEQIPATQILVFEPSADNPAGTDFNVSFLDKKLAQLTPQQNALVLTFGAVNRGTPEHPFAQPKATISHEQIDKARFERRLIEINSRHTDGAPRQWGIIISGEYSGSTDPMETLRGVLVLKRILALNSSLPLTIKDFHVGRQIIFPSKEDIARAVHVIDHQVAQLFYEVKEYYRAFEQEYNHRTKTIMSALGTETVHDEPAKP